MSLYLDVPYSEKDEAKALGAKWNPDVKKWFIQANPKNFIRFSKWILGQYGTAHIISKYIYIIEGTQNCWKCGRQTTIIGLGIGEYCHIYDDDENIQLELSDDHIKEIHLAWVMDENDIPPLLLEYLKKHYSVKIGYSKTAGKCFANHCDCCGAIQGNWFLFSEPDSPLSSCVGGNELIERMENLKIKYIPIKDDLKIDWSIGLCTNDFAYWEYAKKEELILSDNPEDKFVTYKQLYKK